MKHIAKFSFTLLLLCCCYAQADVVVVVHPSNTNAVNEDMIKRLFLGKTKSFPDGSSAVPINQAQETQITNEFDNKVLNKSASQLKAYWSKLVFTGKGTPPKEVENDAEALKLVADNPNIIAYVNAGAINDRVKVVAKF